MNNLRHESLVADYIYNEFIYSRSLHDRLEMDLGFTNYNINLFSDDIDALPDNVILYKLKALKAPWWNCIYGKICKNKTLLLIIYIPFLIKDVIMLFLNHLTKYIK